MVFSSLSFLYFFLPCVIMLYFAVRNRVWRTGVLLLFSLLFYSWGEPRLIFLMLLAGFEAYAGGLAMANFEKNGRLKSKQIAFVLTVSLITANLLVFKYGNFAIENLNALLGTAVPDPQIILPIGISFYTFQILSYVIDLKRGKVALQKNYFLLLLYVSFFPQLIAGPIVRYETVEAEIHQRRETADDFVYGLKRFIVGLGKKVLLANQFGFMTETIYSGDAVIFGTAMYWVAALAYTLQIYFDFSGYSDMAIGLGRMFGFHFLENFNYPYISRSVTEFWRRWHISLSSWFRDYIYIPLGGNRVKRGRWIFNIFVVWSLTGFWHGAQWNFLLWGLYYALLLVAEKLLLARWLEKLPQWLRWIYAMFLVMVGWVIFNRTDFAELLLALRMMFTLQPTDWSALVRYNTPLLQGLLFIPLGLLCMLPCVKKLPQETNGVMTVISCAVHGLLLVLCILVLISSTYNPFIYFRF